MTCILDWEYFQDSQFLVVVSMSGSEPEFLKIYPDLSVERMVYPEDLHTNKLRDPDVYLDYHAWMREKITQCKKLHLDSI